MLLCAANLSATFSVGDCLLMAEFSASGLNLYPNVRGLRRQHDQVFGGVVVDISVDVMDNLAPVERSSEFLSRHSSMNRNRSDFQIPRGFSRLMLPSALLRAVFAGSLGYVGRGQIEDGSAILAHKLRSPSPRFGVADLRAPSALARLAACFTRLHNFTVSDSADKNNEWFSPHCLQSHTLFDQEAHS